MNLPCLSEVADVATWNVWCAGGCVGTEAVLGKAFGPPSSAGGSVCPG